MTTFSVTEAKARFSELLTLAESGEVLVITRRGRPVAELARVHPVKRAPDWQAIRAFRKTMIGGTTTAADLVRATRDAET